MLRVHENPPVSHECARETIAPAFLYRLLYMPMKTRRPALAVGKAGNGAARAEWPENSRLTTKIVIMSR